MALVQPHIEVGSEEKGESLRLTAPGMEEIEVRVPSEDCKPTDTPSYVREGGKEGGGREDSRMEEGRERGRDRREGGRKGGGTVGGREEGKGGRKGQGGKDA